LTYHDLHEIFVSLERSQLLNDKQRKCRSQLINRNYWRFFQDTTTMYYQELVQTLTANRDLTAKQQDAIARAYRQYREHHYTNLSMHRKSNSAPQIPNWQYLIYAATMVENYRQANHQQKIIIQEAGYGHKRTNTAFMEAAALYCEIRGFPYQLYSHNDFLSINSSRGCTHAEIKDSNSEQWSEIADHHARHQQRLQEKASYLFHYAPEILNQLINFEAECTNQRSTPLYAHVDNQALFAQPS
jgi:hypothetical protein